MTDTPSAGPLTPESEALLRDLYRDGQLEPVRWVGEPEDLQARVAAIEAAAIARHVRDTGCEALREAAQALDLFYQHEYLTYCDETPVGPYPIAVSIEHDRRLGDLMEALRAALAAPAASPEAE